MAQFLLIHGAYHGAWCWEEVLPELERLGHRAIAIDLPGNGSDTTPADQVGLAAYVERVGEALDEFEGKVWLVGHSLGGLTITASGEAYAQRLEGLIYVTALLARHGESFASARGGQASQAADQPTIGNLDLGGIGPMFYNTCEPRQIERAAMMLNPVQNLSPLAEIMNLSADRYGTLPRHYVECLRDNALTPQFQRSLYEGAGIESVATLDCDHSPFYSCPADLAAVLDDFASR